MPTPTTSGGTAVKTNVAPDGPRASTFVRCSITGTPAARRAVWVTEDAIRILGGYGYTREYPVDRWHRDAKNHTIFEGTSEIQQLVISRAISGLRIE